MKKRFIDLYPYLLAALGLLVLAWLQPAAAYEWRNAAIGGGGYVPGIVYSEAEPGLVYARTDVGGAYRWNPAENVWMPLTDSFADMNNLGVVSLACDPVDPDRVYIATGLYTQEWWDKNGAIYRSDDRGETWEKFELPIKLGGNDPGRGDGEKLQIDPNDRSILYLATIANGLWKSTDYGESWNQVENFPGTKCTFVALDDTAGNAASGGTANIYAGTFDNLPDTLEGRIYKSSDGGKSWTLLAGQPDQLRPKSYEPANVALPPCALQCAITEEHVFFTFANGPSPHGDYTIENNIVNGAVYRYNKASGEWTEITPDLELQGGYCAMAVHPEDPDTIFAGSMARWWPQDDIHISTDAGETWHSLILDTAIWPHEPVATFDTESAPYVADKLPHWMTGFAINPFNPNEAMFGTGYGVFQCSNLDRALSGTPTHWVFESSGLEETVPQDLISPPEGAPVVSAMGDVDGFRHNNLDQSPAAGAHTPNGGTCVSIDFAQNSPNAMVRSHNSGDFYGSMSWDGGSNWYFFSSQPGGATGGGPIALSADTGHIVWAPAGAAVSFSTDGGSSWTASSGIPAGLEPVADPHADAVFYAYDKINGSVYKSTDGGESFTVSASGLPVLDTWQDGGKLIPVPARPGHLWLALGKNGLYRSTDGAETFQQINSVAAAYLVSAVRAAPAADYPAIFIHGVTGGAEGLYRSDNMGGTWQKINNNEQEWGGYYTCMSADPNRYGRLYLGTQGRGLLYGDMEGEGEAPPPEPVTGLEVSPASASIKMDETLRLSATVLPADAANPAVTWQSGNTEVAEVNASGLVTPRSAGTAVVTGTTEDGGYSASCRITVTDETEATPVTGVSLSPNTLALIEGESAALTAAVTPADASNSNVSWQSANPAVAEVSDSGVVSARSAGSTVITVSTEDGGYTAEAGVTVDSSDDPSDPSDNPSDDPQDEEATGSILREYWTGVYGSGLPGLHSHSAYPDQPSGSEQLSSFEAPTNWGDAYGTRIRGYIHPPEDGTYTFWIAGDDATRLYLSQSADSNGAALIAEVPGWTSPRQWDKFPQQKSGTIELSAGRKYYVEVLHKEDWGGDNIAVAWQGPGISRQIIDGSCLSPADGSADSSDDSAGDDDAPSSGDDPAVPEEGEDGDDNDTALCRDFGTPLTSGLPSINNSYRNVHVIGANGPDLSHASIFTINWSLQHQGLWQFSLNTDNGEPDWYVDLRTISENSFSGVQPDLTFSGSGIPGLDGGYWVAVDAGNFVMVSKNKPFAIYFSNSEQPPCP
mgnify:CR=1 FL=1